MKKKNGVHFIRVEPKQGQVKNKNQILLDKKGGKFIRNEYVIIEMHQIMPLHGLTLKRNEYFVIRRDPNFKGKNFYSDYLNQRKIFIYNMIK